MAEYDKIAKEYADSIEKRVERKYGVDPSFLQAIGGVKGKNVLDLACGDGVFTRKIKDLGAKEVLGIDLSREMIRLARNKEKEDLQGIKYKTGNVLKLKKIKEFDIITAGFLLHYSKNKKELFEMIKNISKNLKNGGRLISINSNPISPISKDKKYGSIVEGPNPIKEGDKLIVRVWENGKRTFTFINYYWAKEAYEKLFKKAGFKKIIWHKTKISKEGIKKLGKKFWEDFPDNNHLIIIEAKK